MYKKFIVILINILLPTVFISVFGYITYRFYNLGNIYDYAMEKRILWPLFCGFVGFFMVWLMIRCNAGKKDKARIISQCIGLFITILPVMSFVANIPFIAHILPRSYMIGTDFALSFTGLFAGLYIYLLCHKLKKTT